MKKHLIFAISISIIFIGLLGCKKSKEITCNLSTATVQAPVEMNITYSATQTGDGTIVSLSYATISGIITIQNPQLPWTITVPVTTSTNISLAATGNVKNGTLKISYDGTSGGATVHGSDSCEQQTN